MNDTTKTIDADDPRLTAYALGEMPREERAEFEALLKTDPALLKQVASVQRVANLLEEDLKAEADEAPVKPLSTAQRKQVETAGAKRPSGRTKPAPKKRSGLIIGMRPVVLAASVLAAGGLGLMMVSGLSPARMRMVSHDGAPAVTTEAPSMDPSFHQHESRPVSPVTLNTGEVMYAPLAPPPTTERPPVTTQALGEDEGNFELGAAMMLETAEEERLGGVDTDTRYVGNVPNGPPQAAPENGFKPTSGETVDSTFSIDVDTASYANVRQHLEHRQMPPKDAVRLEEMINYFSYSYAPPTGTDPFAAHAEVTGCPWQPKHRLVRIGLKGRELDMAKRPAANLVFLIDVSGSMNEPRKLPLVKESLKALVRQTSERDRVAIVVYAGAAGLVLPSTSGDRHEQILGALDRLEAGGGTNGGAGIELAYRVAIENFKDGGINRVVLCSDGDWNVGLTGAALQKLIEQKAKSNVFLTVLGFGGSNFNDRLSETLADKGNGNYALIDDLREAKKVLVEQAAGTLVTIAKDVKIQVSWNPAAVKRYRLLGYENRVMANQDFRDDAKDAGEIGAGHTVTALYEIEPIGPANQKVLTLRLRYKQPEGDTAKELTHEVRDAGSSFDGASEDTRWAASVAAFGMLLRDSRHKGTATWALAQELAQGAVGKDVEGRRAEMGDLITRAWSLNR